MMSGNVVPPEEDNDGCKQEVTSNNLNVTHDQLEVEPGNTKQNEEMERDVDKTQRKRHSRYPTETSDGLLDKKRQKTEPQNARPGCVWELKKISISKCHISVRHPNNNEAARNQPEDSEHNSDAQQCAETEASPSKIEGFLDDLRCKYTCTRKEIKRLQHEVKWQESKLELKKIDRKNCDYVPKYKQSKMQKRGRFAQTTIQMNTEEIPFIDLWCKKIHNKLNKRKCAPDSQNKNALPDSQNKNALPDSQNKNTSPDYQYSYMPNVIGPTVQQCVSKCFKLLKYSPQIFSDILCVPDHISRHPTGENILGTNTYGNMNTFLQCHKTNGERENYSLKYASGTSYFKGVKINSQIHQELSLSIKEISTLQKVHNTPKVNRSNSQLNNGEKQRMNKEVCITWPHCKEEKYCRNYDEIEYVKTASNYYPVDKQNTHACMVREQEDVNSFDKSHWQSIQDHKDVLDKTEENNGTNITDAMRHRMMLPDNKIIAEQNNKGHQTAIYECYYAQSHLSNSIRSEINKEDVHKMKRDKGMGSEDKWTNINQEQEVGADECVSQWSDCKFNMDNDKNDMAEQKKNAKGQESNKSHIPVTSSEKLLKYLPILFEQLTPSEEILYYDTQNQEKEKFTSDIEHGGCRNVIRCQKRQEHNIQPITYFEEAGEEQTSSDSNVPGKKGNYMSCPDSSEQGVKYKSVPRPDSSGPGIKDKYVPCPNSCEPGMKDKSVPKPDSSGPGIKNKYVPKPDSSGPGIKIKYVPCPNSRETGMKDKSVPTPDSSGPGLKVKHVLCFKSEPRPDSSRPGIKDKSVPTLDPSGPDIKYKYVPCPNSCEPGIKDKSVPEPESSGPDIKDKYVPTTDSNGPGIKEKYVPCPNSCETMNKQDFVNGKPATRKSDVFTTEDYAYKHEYNISKCPAECDVNAQQNEGKPLKPTVEKCEYTEDNAHKKCTNKKNPKIHEGTIAADACISKCSDECTKNAQWDGRKSIVEKPRAEKHRYTPSAMCEKCATKKCDFLKIPVEKTTTGTCNVSKCPDKCSSNTKMYNRKTYARKPGIEKHTYKVECRSKKTAIKKSNITNKCADFTTADACNISKCTDSPQTDDNKSFLQEPNLGKHIVEKPMNKKFDAMKNQRVSVPVGKFSVKKCSEQCSGNTPRNKNKYVVPKPTVVKPLYKEGVQSVKNSEIPDSRKYDKKPITEEICVVEEVCKRDAIQQDIESKMSALENKAEDSISSRSSFHTKKGWKSELPKVVEDSAESDKGSTISKDSSKSSSQQSNQAYTIDNSKADNGLMKHLEYSNSSKLNTAGEQTETNSNLLANKNEKARIEAYPNLNKRGECAPEDKSNTHKLNSKATDKLQDSTFSLENSVVSNLEGDQNQNWKEIENMCYCRYIERNDKEENIKPEIKESNEHSESNMAPSFSSLDNTGHISNGSSKNIDLIKPKSVVFNKSSELVSNGNHVCLCLAECTRSGRHVTEDYKEPDKEESITVDKSEDSFKLDHPKDDSEIGRNNLPEDDMQAVKAESSKLEASGNLDNSYKCAEGDESNVESKEKEHNILDSKATDMVGDTSSPLVDHEDSNIEQNKNQNSKEFDSCECADIEKSASPVSKEEQMETKTKKSGKQEYSPDFHSPGKNSEEYKYNIQSEEEELGSNESETISVPADPEDPSLDTSELPSTIITNKLTDIASEAVDDKYDSTSQNLDHPTKDQELDRNKITEGNLKVAEREYNEPDNLEVSPKLENECKCTEEDKSIIENVEDGHIVLESVVSEKSDDSSSPLLVSEVGTLEGDRSQNSKGKDIPSGCTDNERSNELGDGSESARQQSNKTSNASLSTSRAENGEQVISHEFLQNNTNQPVSEAESMQSETMGSDKDGHTTSSELHTPVANLEENKENLQREEVSEIVSEPSPTDITINTENSGLDTTKLPTTKKNMNPEYKESNEPGDSNTSSLLSSLENAEVGDSNLASENIDFIEPIAHSNSTSADTDAANLQLAKDNNTTEEDVELPTEHRRITSIKDPSSGEITEPPSHGDMPVDPESTAHDTPELSASSRCSVESSDITDATRKQSTTDSTHKIETPKDILSVDMDDANVPLDEDNKITEEDMELPMRIISNNYLSAEEKSEHSSRGDTSVDSESINVYNTPELGTGAPNAILVNDSNIKEDSELSTEEIQTLNYEPFTVQELSSEQNIQPQSYGDSPDNSESIEHDILDFGVSCNCSAECGGIIRSNAPEKGSSHKAENSKDSTSANIDTTKELLVKHENKNLGNNEEPCNTKDVTHDEPGNIHCTEQGATGKLPMEDLRTASSNKITFIDYSTENEMMKDINNLLEMLNISKKHAIQLLDDITKMNEMYDEILSQCRMKKHSSHDELLTSTKEINDDKINSDEHNSNVEEHFINKKSKRELVADTEGTYESKDKLIMMAIVNPDGNSTFIKYHGKTQASLKDGGASGYSNFLDQSMLQNTKNLQAFNKTLDIVNSSEFMHPNTYDTVKTDDTIIDSEGKNQDDVYIEYIRGVYNLEKYCTQEQNDQIFGSKKAILTVENADGNLMFSIQCDSTSMISGHTNKNKSVYGKYKRHKHGKTLKKQGILQISDQNDQLTSNNYNNDELSIINKLEDRQQSHGIVESTHSKTITTVMGYKNFDRRLTFKRKYDDDSDDDSYTDERHDESLKIQRKLQKTQRKQMIGSHQVINNNTLTDSNLTHLRTSESFLLPNLLPAWKLQHEQNVNNSDIHKQCSLPQMKYIKLCNSSELEEDFIQLNSKTLKIFNAKRLQSIVSLDFEIDTQLLMTNQEHVGSPCNLQISPECDVGLLSSQSRENIIESRHPKYTSWECGNVVRVQDDVKKGSDTEIQVEIDLFPDDKHSRTCCSRVEKPQAIRYPPEVSLSTSEDITVHSDQSSYQQMQEEFLVTDHFGIRDIGNSAAHNLIEDQEVSSCNSIQKPTRSEHTLIMTALTKGIRYEKDDRLEDKDMYNPHISKSDNFTPAVQKLINPLKILSQTKLKECAAPENYKGQEFLENFRLNEIDTRVTNIATSHIPHTSNEDEIKNSESEELMPFQRQDKTEQSLLYPVPSLQKVLNSEMNDTDSDDNVFVYPETNSSILDTIDIKSSESVSSTYSAQSRRSFKNMFSCFSAICKALKRKK